MDPYIINNMPDDDMPEAVGHMRVSMLVGSTEPSSLHVDLCERVDVPGYELTLSQGETSVVVAAFDPTLNLKQVLVILKVLMNGAITQGSDEINQAARELLGTDSEDADQNV